MQTYSFDLLFLPSPKDVLPGPPISEIRLKNYTMSGYTGIPDAPTLTPRCLSYKELSHQIDRLVSELEAIRTKAEGRYSLQKQLQDETGASVI